MQNLVKETLIASFSGLIPQKKKKKIKNSVFGEAYQLEWMELIKSKLIILDR